MKYEVGEIYFFKKYNFTDKNAKVVKPRNTIIFLSRNSFKNVSKKELKIDLSNQALFCSIVTDAKEKYTHKLKKQNYGFLKNDSYACATRVDIQNINEIDSYKGMIRKDDAKLFYKQIVLSLKSPYTQHVFCKKQFVKAAILLEWKFYIG